MLQLTVRRVITLRAPTHRELQLPSDKVTSWNNFTDQHAVKRSFTHYAEELQTTHRRFYSFKLVQCMEHAQIFAAASWSSLLLLQFPFAPNDFTALSWSFWILGPCARLDTSVDKNVHAQICRKFLKRPCFSAFFINHWTNLSPF